MPPITPNLWFDPCGPMLGMKKIDLAALHAAADQA